MVRRMLVVVVFLVSVSPIQAMATLYDYRVTGNFLNDNAVTSVSGTMTISDVFQSDFRNDGSFAGYSFDITRFSLDVSGAGGPFTFAGDTINRPGGWDSLLAWALVSRQYEAIYQLGNSTDYWINNFDNVRFYLPDGSGYDPTSQEYFGQLSPSISMAAPVGPTNLPYNVTGGGMWLERMPAPVPEPCTLLLMGSGLAGLGLVRRRSGAVANR